MRDNVLLLSNAQSRTNPTSTGTVTSNVLDMEQDSSSNVLLTNDQVEGFMNVVVTSATLSSGGTEGISLQVRNGDNSDLTTGAEIIGNLDVILTEFITGAKFSVPFKRDIAERYLGGWLAAKSTTYTGTIIVDAEFSDKPWSPNETIQKVVS
jgi:hypothetical protein